MISIENESEKENNPFGVYAKKVEGERYFRCAFHNQSCSWGITRLKEHTGGMKPCCKVTKEANVLFFWNE